MPSRFACVWWSVGCCLCLTFVTVTAQRSQPLRSRTELVVLPVTAQDARGRLVRDLVESDFRILENGRAQPITFFSDSHVPTAISLLIDTSASMEANLAATRVAASAIVGRLRSSDMGQVITFSTTVDVRQDFTSDHAQLQRAIESTSASGATALYNALYIGLRGLQKHRAPGSDVHREAILLLSDGEDTASLVEFDQVLDVARASQTLIYTIDLQIGTDPIRQRTSPGGFVLRRLAEQTGGRTYLVTDVRQLDRVYEEIYDAIAASYVLAYMPLPDGSPNKWRVISVTVDRPGVTARTRAGYFQP
ncbi:MAG: VWA domain-containing protein [Chloroflexota bacterium]|nr:VWA domain-containing protein [Chloroflexota bacterium]